MAHAQKPDLFFLRNGRVLLNRQGRQFSRLLAAEVCASAVVMLDTPSSEVVWMVLATHSIRQFPLHFPSRASPCAITFQLDFTSERSHLLDINTSFYNSPRTNRPMVILTRLDRVSLAASCHSSVRRCKFEGKSARFFRRFQSMSVSVVTHIQ
jgi:hypothetical protein